MYKTTSNHNFHSIQEFLHLFPDFCCRNDLFMFRCNIKILKELFFKEIYYEMNEQNVSYCDKMYQVITCFLSNYIHVLFYIKCLNQFDHVFVDKWLLFICSYNINNIKKPLEFMNIPWRLPNITTYKCRKMCKFILYNV